VVSQCANPECGVPLHYLRDGRLYQFEVRALNHVKDQPGTKKKPLRQVWHYWLCGSCSSILTLQFDQRKGLQVAPLSQECSLVS
jgi:hypothetical protein